VKVAVTGGSGFVGRALCEALVRAGHEPLPVNARNGSLEAGEAVVHLAAIAHRKASADELERVNVGLARRIGELAAARGVPLVFVSSVKVHGETSRLPFKEDSPITPEDAYAESKARAEEGLRSISGLRLAVLRPPLVYGPHVKANFLALMRAVALGLPLPLASVKNRRSLVYVGNLADAIVRCLGAQGTYLVSDGPGVSAPELCEGLGRALGRPARLLPFPSAWLPAKLAGSLEVDDSAIRRALGWQPPCTFEQGLRATAEWYRGR
jgi:UDP-glucose 4-epimerase